MGRLRGDHLPVVGAHRLQSVDILLDLAIFVPIIVVFLYVLMRFGLLAMVGMGFLSVSALGTPISVASWYAGASLAASCDRPHRRP